MNNLSYHQYPILETYNLLEHMDNNSNFDIKEFNKKADENDELRRKKIKELSDSRIKELENKEKINKEKPLVEQLYNNIESGIVNFISDIEVAKRNNKLNYKSFIDILNDDTNNRKIIVLILMLIIVIFIFIVFSIID